jgi:toxin ParE1/3/4
MRSGRRLELTDDAEADLRSLLEYTEHAWGVEQKIRYADLLSRAMHELLAYPELGSMRNELAQGLRGRHLGQHVIFYLVLQDSIRIIRILHAKMNPATHLLERPGGE